MNEKPILFNAEMVRAILAGDKTQDRQPMKCSSWKLVKILADGRAVFDVAKGSLPAADVVFVKSPFGAVGDLLWVRETWTAPAYEDWKPSEMPHDIHIRYKATDKNATDKRYEYRWCPSIHMPRWASRLTLRVKRVWVERVQDIEYKNCIAEGVVVLGDLTLPDYLGAEMSGVIRRVYRDSKERRCTAFGAKAQFANLWDSIYTDKGYGWDTNPYVWACEFEVVNE